MELEARLMEAFFRGFNEGLDRNLRSAKYRLDILAHCYHEVDSIEFSYHRAGKNAGEWHSMNPSAFSEAGDDQ